MGTAEVRAGLGVWRPQNRKGGPLGPAGVVRTHWSLRVGQGAGLCETVMGTDLLSSPQLQLCHYFAVQP